MAEPLIVWNDKLEMGIHEIDEQHRILVDILNKFHDAIHPHKRLLDELIETLKARPARKGRRLFDQEDVVETLE